MIIVVAKKTHDPIPAERFEKLHADATFATPDGTPTVSDLTDKSPFIKLSVVMMISTAHITACCWSSLHHPSLVAMMSKLIDH